MKAARTLDEMANDYSVRARAARVQQGKPPVVTDPSTLRRLADIIAKGDAEPEARRKQPGSPAA